MIRTTSNFNTENAKTEKKPVFVIEFDGISTKFCTGTFSDIDSNYKKYASKVQIIGANIDPIRFNFSSYGYDFDIIDINDTVTGLFASNNLMNNKVTIKFGYQNLAIADFIEYPPAYIIDYQFGSDFMTYHFKSRDSLTYLKKPIFQGIAETYLTAGLVSADSAEHLNETNFTNHANWDVTNDWSDSGGNARYIFSTQQTSTLTQTQDNLIHQGKGSVTYTFTYTVTQNTAFDGNGRFKITANFANIVTILTHTTGTHSIQFESAVSPGDFVIEAVSGTDTQGDYTFDNFSLKAEGNIALVNDESAFTSAGSATWGEDTKTYLKIGNELVEYTDSDTGQFTITRGQLGTQTQEHNKGDKVSEVYCIFTNPYQLLLEILQTSAGGADGTYDLGLTGYGLGVGDYTDEIQIKNDFERYKFSTSESSDRQYWVITKREDNGLNFIIENILKVIPAYLKITENGLIGIRWWDLPVNGEGYDDITLANSKKQSLTVLGKDVISYIEMYRAYNGGLDDWDDIDQITNNAIPAAYGEQIRMIIKPYIYSGLATVLNTTILQSVFMRHGNPSLQVKAEVFSPKLLLQVGDIVDVTNANFPIYNNGTKGWSERGCEIVNSNINISSGFNVSYEMLNFNTHEKVNLFSGSLFTETDIDDTDLTLDATGSDALGANDAYIDTGLTSLDNYVVCTIQADLPGGSSGEENITLELRIQHTDTTGTDMEEKKIYYDPGKSGTQEWEIRVSRITALKQTQRVKVDWTAESAGAGDKLTNVKFVKCKVIKYEVTSYTTTDLK